MSHHFSLPSTSASGSRPRATRKERLGSTWITEFEKMKKEHQLAALNELVGVCKPAQLRHLQQTIEPLLQKDFISLLPRELSHHILLYLNARELLQASQICTKWRVLCEDNLLWREKCHECGVKPDEMPPNLSRRDYWALSPDNVLNNVANPDNAFDNRSGRMVENRMMEPETENSVYKRAYWKATYMRQHRILRNWIENKPTAQCHLTGHDEHVITGLQVAGNIIATASDDTTVRIWSVTEAKCTHVLHGHVGGVWTLLLTENGERVISGSTDRTVRVWDTRTGEILHVLNGHTSTVRCMAMHRNRLVTGSRDCSIRLWDLDTGECLGVYMAHYAAIRCVQFDGSRIISGSYDYKIAVFDAEKAERRHLLVGHTNRVYSLLLNAERSIVVSGSLDTTIRIWDIDAGACLHTLLGHQSLTSGMQLRGNVLVSANADSTIKVWDIEQGVCVHTLTGPHRHMSAVTSLQFLRDDMIVTSSDDGTVKLWDVDNGQFMCNLVKLCTQRAGGCVWRLETTPTMLCCAVGSRNGAEDTKLILLDFDAAFP